MALAFEAAVAGGIPVIKALREGLAGNRVSTRLRHPQRHLQLHPDDDARERARVRRGARRGAEARLCRGRSELRHRRHRRRAQAGASWPASPSAGRSISPASMSRASATSRALDIDFADELGYRIKLLGIARLTEHGLEQRVHPCMVPRGDADRRGRGRLQRGRRRGRFRRPRRARRARRRRRCRPPRRWSPISSISPPGARVAGVRRAGRRAAQRCPARRWSGTRAPITCG